jgi:hypothetical protein
MARNYRASGDIERAQQAYQRALHVVRINEGLYSETQVPLLKALFETYRLSGDLATLDARYDYYFRLYGSGQPPYTPVRLTAALEYLRWQREALRLHLDSSDAQRLLALYALNDQLIAGVTADTGADFELYRQLVLSQLRNIYLLQSRYHPKVESTGVVSRNFPPAAWEEEEDPHQQRLENLQRNALARGRALLQDLVARTPPEQLELLAGAYLELADWNQWNDRRAEALAAYRKVVELLRRAGRDELLSQWFGAPVELPANGAFWQPRGAAGDVHPVVVHARYDVSAAGRAKNIETTSLAEEDDAKAGRVRRQLAETRFRPRLLDGAPQSDPDLQRDYEVLN